MKRVIVFLLMLLVPGLAHAVECGPPNTTWVAYEYEDITVSTSAVGFTAAKIQPSGAPVGAGLVDISVETDNVRLRLDGGVPTSTVGHEFLASSTTQSTASVCGEQNIRLLLMIRSGSVDAAVRVTYYRSQ